MAGKDKKSNGGSRRTPPVLCDKLFNFLSKLEDGLPEVDVINNYALFMGYLSMALRGLAFLVVTWTTVILLGGFVSVLGKKDFLCLTVITLSQTVGVFDVFLKEKLSGIWHAKRGLFNATLSSMKITIIHSTITLDKLPPNKVGKYIFFQLKKWLGRRPGGTKPRRESPRRKWDACGVIMVVMFFVLGSVAEAGVQAVLFAVMLLPLAVLYLLGLYISTAISLWRLIQHDYDGKTADGSGNLKPALNVLYSLAVLQGLVFCYKTIFSFREENLVQAVSKDWEEDSAAAPAVREYLHETKAGCEKDPSFAKRRNLATYAVDLIESSNSPDSYLSGIRILDVLLHYSPKHPLFIRHLIGWGSSGHVIHKLLGTIGPRSPYDDETRNRATSIVKHLANTEEICLEQFPGGIRCISSMLDNNDTSRVNDGLRIIGDLAAGDEDNRRIISSTQGLLSRVVALLGGAEGLHRDHRDTWYGAACVIARLIADRGEESAGVKVRRQVSTSSRAIGAMESVLKCVECTPWDRIKANDILADLSLSVATSTEENLATPYRGRKEEILVGILTDSFFPREGEVILIDNSVNGKNRESREFAGKKLAELSLESISSATIIWRANDVVSNLISMLLDAGNNSSDRKNAAEILKNLCSHYTNDDKCFDTLKRDLTDVMPKVLREVSGWSSTGEEIQEITGPNCVPFSAPGTDLEKGRSSKDTACRNSSVDEDYHTLKEALLSLCTTVLEEEEEARARAKEVVLATTRVE